jgi:hypothetical protein
MRDGNGPETGGSRRSGPPALATGTAGGTAQTPGSQGVRLGSFRRAPKILCRGARRRRTSLKPWATRDPGGDPSSDCQGVSTPGEPPLSTPSSHRAARASQLVMKACCATRISPRGSVHRERSAAKGWSDGGSIAFPWPSIVASGGAVQVHMTCFPPAASRTGRPVEGRKPRTVSENTTPSRP